MKASIIRRQKLLTAITKKPNATYVELSKMTGIHSLSQVHYGVEGLVLEGLIRKNDRYTVVEERG